jgi:hypothetical protein
MIPGGVFCKENAVLFMVDTIKRWRLILGEDAEERLNTTSSPLLNDNECAMDRALAALYNSGATLPAAGIARSAGLGASYPNVAKWLTDIRRFFPKEVVHILQNDAIERKGLKHLLMEPETLAHVEPDIDIVSTLMALKDEIPAKSKEQVRMLVQTLVNQIMKDMEHALQRAVTGALNRKQHSPIPSLPHTDWKRTITKNLKNYNREKKQIIPEKFYFFDKHKVQKEWNVILDMDQSGSMADSIIYASIMGCIFASIPALDAHIIAFDTTVVNLTEQCGTDPVDILFGVQLGGGTDINKSVSYCSSLIENPKKTLFILISDLYEGGVEAGLLRQLEDLKGSGVTVLVLLALSDRGSPAYDERLARKIVSLGIPAFACTPQKVPELIAKALKGEDLRAQTP